MAFPAFLDTCVLFPAYLNDVLLTQAHAAAFRPLWSADVLEELRRNLSEKTRMADHQVEHRLDQMRRAFPDAEVCEYTGLVAAMTCDPKDRHVLAAAVRGNAEVLVTNNLRDFPRDSLAPYDISAISADDFLLDQLDLYPALVMGCLNRQVNRYSGRTGITEVAELLHALHGAGAERFADEARRHLH